MKTENKGFVTKWACTIVIIICDQPATNNFYLATGNNEMFITSIPVTFTKYLGGCLAQE